MGCNNSKREENTQPMFLLCWRRQNKVAPTNISVPVSSLDTGTSNTARKTKHTVLLQLREEGIVPRKGEGGVAFVLDVGCMSASDDSTSSALPGVPQYRRNYPQYATYSQEACKPGIPRPPRRLPPINRASIDAKLERARRNRERKAAERKAKWAKSYARVQATMEKKSNV